MSGTRTKLNQAGMVSFMVTMIMMIVITLIVLGFSQVTRRSQREALDRQLSSQAFYAAESGINATTATIQNYVTANGLSGLATKNACTNGTNATDYKPDGAGGQGGVIQSLSSADNVAYTCVLVNPNPKSLIYDVSMGESKVANINASGKLRTLTFQWFKQAGSVDTSCAGASGYDFPAFGNWTCGYGVLRIDLMAVPSPAALTNADQLSANTITLFLTPQGQHAAALNAPNYTSTKTFVGSGSQCTATAVCTTGVQCTSTGSCGVKLTLPGDSAQYYARMTSIYRDAANTTISGTLTSGGSAALFNGSQAVIDVTGRAQDELRRVQVRMALTATASDDVPMNALSSGGDICKNFSIAPDSTISPSDVCND